MSIQTIPPIEDMTPAQQVELMEELWSAMSRRAEEMPSPAWHLEELERREKAIADGTDEFVDLDEFIKLVGEPHR